MEIIKLCLLVVIGVLSGYSKAETAGASAPLDKLVSTLFKDYNKIVIPDTTGLNVSHSINLIRIVGLEDQVLTLNAYISTQWKDKRLSWNPENYGGVKDIRIPVEMLWQPDIMLYNSAEDYTGLTKGINAVIKSDGTVISIPPVHTKSYCEVKTKSMKRHHKVSCEMKIGSWTYNQNQIDLIPESDSMDVSTYVPNPMWKFGTSTAVKKVEKYDCCPEEYVTILYTLTMKYMDSEE